MPSKSKACSTAKNTLKQQLQLKTSEWKATKQLILQKSCSREIESALCETLKLLRSDDLYRICADFMNLQLTTDELTTLGEDSVLRNTAAHKYKQTI